MQLKVQILICLFDYCTLVQPYLDPLRTKVYKIKHVLRFYSVYLSSEPCEEVYVRIVK